MKGISGNDYTPEYSEKKYMYNKKTGYSNKVRFSRNSSTQRSVPALYTDHKTPKQPNENESVRNL